MMKDRNKIREMVIGDLEQVMVLERACFSSPWSEASFRNEIEHNDLANYIVVESNDEIVGYGGVWYIMDEGHITNVCVHPDFRKHGLGKRLVDEMMTRAKAADIHHMTLEVRVSYVPAITLYERMGFQTAGVRPNYYTDNNEDAQIMWVSL
jgi:ribosomal-protein-alanine N-acetyltransferase